MVITDISKFDACRLNLLEHKIKNIKADFDSLLTDTSYYLKGPRYNDDKRIARMVLGKLFVISNYKEKEACELFLSLDSEEIVPFIKAAVLDAANADHWYTYEKQW